MTRINVGIDPSELNRAMLLAEHREIKRIPNCIRKGRYNLSGIPTEFKLGNGHVKFFYNKLLYLQKRYERIYQVCVEKHYDVTYYGDSFKNLPENLMNDYKETESDRKLLLDRIQTRLKECPKNKKPKKKLKFNG